MRHRECSLVAQSRHAQCADECPLLGAKRTSLIRFLMFANDPKRTLRRLLKLLCIPLYLSN